MIFIEVKNAYKTLSDGPTRRQYDYDRERDTASSEAHGKKPMEKPSFDAIKAFLLIMEKAKADQKPPGDDVKVTVMVRLEKFVFGGHKAVNRMRAVKDKEFGGYKDQERVFRIDVPPGAAAGWSCDFRRAGDHHEDREPDNLNFSFQNKTHSHMERSGQDLKVKNTMDLPDCHRAAPYFEAHADSVGGQHVFFLGPQPLLSHRERGRVCSGDAPRRWGRRPQGRGVCCEFPIGPEEHAPAESNVVLQRKLSAGGAFETMPQAILRAVRVGSALGLHA